MPLTAGNRLGPYEILAPLGAGGMGEVYKARDTRLERTVAIKVLPAGLADDPDFKARFEREAKSISALNHPHICTLYDIGDAGGTSFIVMEHLEGETLADRLKKGPLPPDDAIELAGQIANALDRAHRQGIVHRDLKPANVFVLKGATADTTPICKLLDFGLAKIGAAVKPGTVETRLLTSASMPGHQTAPLTSQGTILGTFQYMAPEQIEGQEADARADIWAFGCVLYEMLTGRRAFEGKSQASLIASILERQPTPMAELQPMTPPALGRIVRTCLEKNPDNRFHTAHDLWLHLQWIEEGRSAAGLPAPVVTSRRRRDRAMFGGAALVLALFAAAGAWWLKPPPPAESHVVSRFSYALPTGVAFTRTGRRTVAVSTDGTKLAYIANNQIYLRRMDELEAQPIRGTDIDPLDLMFSPDGESLAFFSTSSAGGEVTALKRIPVTGGAAVPVCPSGPPFGGRWQGDRIVFSLGDRILSVPATGGKPETLVTAAVAEGVRETLAQPQLLDDGRMLLYTVRVGSSFNIAQIVIQPTAGGPRRVLVEGGTDGRVTTDGHLIWLRESTLYAQAIDLSSWQLRGGPVAMVEGIRQANTSGSGQLALSDSGTLVFTPGASGGQNDLVWVDRTGREEPTGAPTQSWTYPRISPDGTRVVGATTDGDTDLWIWDLTRKTISKLTSGPDVDLYPVWTPDSKNIVFRSGTVGGQLDLYRRAADNTGTVERLTQSPEAESPQMVFDGGRSLLIRRAATDVSAIGTLAIVPLVPGAPGTPGATPPNALGTLADNQTSGEISPDGRWIVYQSSEGSTRAEIHVRPFPNTDGGHWQISSGGGAKPVWATSGKELFYVSGAQGLARLMRVAVLPARPGGPFLYESPVVQLDVAKYIVSSIGRSFDIAPDGQRFLVIKQQGLDDASRLSIVVVTHFADELAARVKIK